MNDNKAETITKKIFIGKTLRIFISYSHRDKRIAGAIKNVFNHYGIEAFLAHEDIQVGKEWRDTILSNLKQFDVFVAILSKNFLESEWTNQEVGFAICKGTTIIPISIDGTPPSGFLEIFQGLMNFKYEEHINSLSNEKILDCEEGVSEIIKIITTRPDLMEGLKDSLIKSISDLSSYRGAEKHLKLLNSLDPFNKEQINEIINQSIENNQVYDAHGCQSILKDLMVKYDNNIEINLKSKMLELITK